MSVRSFSYRREEATGQDEGAHLESMARTSGSEEKRGICIVIAN